MERNVPQNGNFVRAILEFAKKWLESKKGRKKGDKYYLETYLEGVQILFSEDSCVVKGKCYRSMRKTEAPHKLRKLPPSVHVKLETGKC